MKKRIIFGIIITVLLTIGIIVQANYTDEVVGVRGNYPIFINGRQAEQDLSMVLIEDRIYLPLRALCDILKIDIEWTNEQTVEITADESGIKHAAIDYTDDVLVTLPSDFEITRETALVIAEDVFLQIRGEEYISKTGIKIGESDDKSCYKVLRHPIPIKAGGGMTVLIRKSDGKIMRVDIGE